MTSSLSPLDLTTLPRTQAMADTGAAVTTPAQRQAMQAAKDFESLLVHELLKEMKETIPAGADAEAGSEQIQGMFWSFLSQEITSKGGLGLWKSLYRQMEPHLSGAAAAAPPPGLEQSL